eukprot:gene8397-9256_t
MAAVDQVKLRKRLEHLLKLPDNQQCADCRKRGPRWASANLGIFICIECSGIHRNLGVHISFVRSVNLDSWTQKQVEFMEEWGNGRANAFYEAKVPASVIRPKEGDPVRIVERFIRDKYEHKKFIADQLPPPNHHGHHNAEPNKETVSNTARRASAAPAEPVKPVAKPVVAAPAPKPVESTLIDFMSEPTAPTPVAPSAPAPVDAFSQHNDGFGDFASAPSHSAAAFAATPAAAGGYGFDAFAAPVSAPAAPVASSGGSLLDLLSSSAPVAVAPQAQPQTNGFAPSNAGFNGLPPTGQQPKQQASADAILSLYSAGMNRGPGQMVNHGPPMHGQPQMMHGHVPPAPMSGYNGMPSPHLQVPHYGNNMLNNGYNVPPQPPSMVQMQNPYMNVGGAPPVNPFAGGMMPQQMGRPGFPPSNPFPGQQQMAPQYNGWPQQR